MRDDRPAVRVLLVEDSPADVVLTKEALRRASIPMEVSTVGDGVEALAFLRRENRYVDAPRPDLILLDLNLPRRRGDQVLAEMTSDPTIATIPVIVLTTSRSEADVSAAYAAGANCYVAKPFDLDEFDDVIRSIEKFWMELAMLPAQSPDPTAKR